MRAWVFQDSRQKQSAGKVAAWSVGWYDPDGHRCSKRIGTRSQAENAARKIEGEIAANTYRAPLRATWAEFMVDYEAKILEKAEPATRESTLIAINHFERIIKPIKMSSLKSKTFADYVSARRGEPRNKKSKNPEVGPRVSPATVNKELRALRAIIKRARRWGYLAAEIEFEFLREPGKHPTYVSPEDFTALYGACDSARRPTEGNVTPAVWWRALLITAYMTGWRIGQILALRWEDVDLEKGTALSRAADNKGKRDMLIGLHPVVLDHLQTVRSFHVSVFPWDIDRRPIYKEFERIQTAAKVKPQGKRFYGFHDLRRAFATMNADRLTADMLQVLMQHKDYKTTQRYINMARQLMPAVAELFVPTIGKATAVR